MKKTPKTETKVVEVQSAKPTSRTVEKLLGELVSSARHYNREWPSTKVDKEMDRELEKFKKTPKMRNLRALYQKLVDQENEFCKKLDKRIQKARQLYYVEGTSLRVLAELRKLMEDVHNGRV